MSVMAHGKKDEKLHTKRLWLDPSTTTTDQFLITPHPPTRNQRGAEPTNNASGKINHATEYVPSTNNSPFRNTIRVIQRERARAPDEVRISVLVGKQNKGE
jgi:hypothetical protein